MNKILLVEDYPVIHKMSKMLLENIEALNCKVDVATCGREAIELIDKNRYDLILLDIGLPDIKGVAIAKHIRNHENSHVSKVPIIAITAHTLDKEAKECLDAGMQKVLEKPLTHAMALSFLPYLS